MSAFSFLRRRFFLPATLSFHHRGNICMNEISFISTLLIALLTFAIGIWIGRNMLHKILGSLYEQAQQKAALIEQEALKKGETFLKEKELEAKDYFLKLKSEHQKEMDKKRSLLQTQEEKVKKLEHAFQQNSVRLKQKETQLQKELEQVGREKERVEQLKEDWLRKNESLIEERKSLEKLKKEQLTLLERLAQLSREEAKKQLFESVQQEARTEASAKMHQILSEAQLAATKEAKRIVLTTIQRTATEHTIENCVSIFHLESDDVKGKIIGREGRNIRTLEAATGVEIIVDDTPEAITLSGFDPVRREIARLSLQRLVADGRIHPARIEEVVAKTSEQLEEQILELGERAVIELGIHGLHVELIKLVGRMRFRSSYAQNLLQHSKEVARLCAAMASEMGLNAKLAKRAGLLHDIGKVYTDDSENGHAIVGMELAKKYGEHPEVCNAIGAHHGDIEMTSLISPIVQACDAISGSRPGARRETTDSYLKRLHDLEKLATSYEGVHKCYAMQAGRELRVLVDAENVSDERAQAISYDISTRIEKEMQYPGQIKVTVIREKRAVSYAK